MRSIPTSETRTHASMTIPLSRTRSRTSIRLVPPAARSTGIEHSFNFLRWRLLHACHSAVLAIGRRRERAANCRSSARTCFRRFSFSADSRCLPGDRWWSNFHQSSPICSALSIEQMSSRIRIVSSSTSARDTFISPATTKPLSRTRSSTSTRPVDRPCPSVKDGIRSYSSRRPSSLAYQTDGRGLVCRSNAYAKTDRSLGPILRYRVQPNPTVGA
jgi:hypothetical protein